jgi:hypothetical protein
MSISKALADARLSPFDKVVFVYLIRTAGIKKECWPSYETIMKCCSITSRNALCRSVKKMDKLGYFVLCKKSTGKKRHNLYRFANISAEYLQNEFLAVENEFCKYGEELLAK